MSEKMETKTVKELEKICKDLGITYYVGKKHITKSEMIEKINNKTNGDVKEENPEMPIEVKEQNEDVKSDAVDLKTKNIIIVKNDDVEEVELPDPNSFLANENREVYIENAEVGTLVAFLDEKDKPRTAAIVNRSSKRRLLKVVTEFGWEFIVSYDKVLWVKNGSRWPKGIYTLLKGYSKYGKRANK